MTPEQVRAVRDSFDAAMANPPVITEGSTVVHFNS
jgi:hypothetical protein